MSIRTELDKQAHFFAGGFIAGAVAVVTVPLLGFEVGLVVAALLAALAGCVKELWDGQHPEHVVDWADARATALGGLTLSTWWFVTGYAIVFLLGV